jgi:hypothetical protein
MQILEELGTFIIAVALALVLLGVAAVLLYYFNPQQPLDYAKAAFHPLVKPINATHVWLGVKPSADKVEVVELKYQYGGRWVDVPLARLTADRAVWLNTTDGRPVVAPCFANVTVVTRYGTASRAVSFTPVCIQRSAEIASDLTSLEHALVSYADYVLDYALYAKIPVLAAYFGSVELRNIGKYPYVLMFGNNMPQGASFYIDSAPHQYFKTLMPDESIEAYGVPISSPNTIFTKYGKPVKGIWQGNELHVYDSHPNASYPYVVGEAYRWLNIAVQRNGSNVVVWMNTVKVYNGTIGTATVWDETRTASICLYKQGQLCLQSCSATTKVGLANGTAVAYDIVVSLPGCPKVYIHNSPVPAFMGGRIYIGPDAIYGLLKNNGYDPDSNPSCKASLDEWRKQVSQGNPCWGLVYTYTRPIAVAKLVDTPLGLRLGLDSDKLYVLYKKRYFTADSSNNKLVELGWEYALAAFLDRPTSSIRRSYISLESWSGWVYLQNSLLAGNFSRVDTIYVMPAGPWFGRPNKQDGGWSYDMFGVIPPIRGYNFAFFTNSSGLVVRWADPSCGLKESCVKTQVLSSPGIYTIPLYSPSSGLPTINGMALYVDPQIAIAMHLHYDYFRTKAFAVVDWYSPLAGQLVVPGYGYPFQVGSGPYTCQPRSSGASWDGYSNRVFAAELNNGWWEVRCQYQVYQDGTFKTYSFTYRVEFKGSTIEVYKDGQLVRKLSVTYEQQGRVPVLKRPAEAVVYWDGRTYAVAYTGTSYTDPKALVSYGHVYHGINPYAVPVMYVFTGPTGAYVYKLTTNIKSMRVWADTTAEQYPDGTIAYYTYANYSFAGYLELTFSGGIASYDAIYGWGVDLVRVQYKTPPPPPPTSSESPEEPEGKCVPVIRVQNAGIEHKYLQKGDGSYSVDVYKKYIVTESGCGETKTYTVYQYVKTETVDGTTYHVRDPCGRKCGYQQAQNCGGTVYCGCCSCGSCS